MNKRSGLLAKDEMKAALAGFSECCTVCSKSYVESDQIKLSQLIESLKLIYPTYALRPDNLLKINEMIFQDSLHVNYIFDVAFRFFSMYSDRNDFALALCRNITQGLMIDGPDLEMSIIPSEISDNCPVNLFTTLKSPAKWWQFNYKKDTEKDIYLFLLNNKHIAIFFLIHLTFEIN